MTDEILSRAEARAKGCRFYFTGKACKRGHIAQRITANATCQVCYDQTLMLWRARNPERMRETDRIHRAGDVEKHRERDRLWRENNIEKVREADRLRYITRDVELYRKHRRDRKARVKGASGSHTLEQLNSLFDKQKRKCVYCFDRLTMSNRHLDHIEPLIRGGSNDIANLQWTCATCNLKKHAKDPIAFANQHGRLI